MIYNYKINRKYMEQYMYILNSYSDYFGATDFKC